MRMSDAEAVMWAVEKDPALRSDFCNLTILDHAPDEKRLRHTLDRALAAIPRLRQRVVSPPLRIAPPEFADDPSLDLDYHVRRIAVPAPHDMRALLDVCEQLAESPLDRSRPLWEFTLLDGLSVDDGVTGGRAALLQKVHHTISDGVGGLKLSMALLDTEPDLIAPPEPDGRGCRSRLDGSRGPVEVLRSALTDATARNIAALRNVAGGTASVLVHPTTLPGRAVDSVRVARSLAPPGLRRRRRALGPHRGPVAAAALRGPPRLARLARTRRERARRQRQRRVRHRRLRRARPLPRALRERRSGNCGWRCPSAPAGGATPARTGSHRRGSSCRSSPRTISKPCSPRCTSGSRPPSRNRRWP